MTQPEHDGSADAAPKPETLAVLVENHRRFLAFLERRVGNRAVAEDILQEAFLRGMGKLGSLRDDESVLAWFYRLLRNAVIDHGRRGKAVHSGLAAFATEVEKSIEPDVDTAKTICQCVAQLAATLKPEYREALRRVELDGLQVKAFASESGISSSNAAVRVFRARQALRKQVARCCGTCADHGCFDCTCGSVKAGERSNP